MILRLQKIEKTKCDNDIDHDSVNLEVLSPISNLYFPDISPSLLVLQGVIVLIFSIFGVSLLFSFECKTEANQSLNTIYISWIGGKKERKITKSIILKKKKNITFVEKLLIYTYIISKVASSKCQIKNLQLSPTIIFIFNLSIPNFQLFVL